MYQMLLKEPLLIDTATIQSEASVLRHLHLHVQRLPPQAAGCSRRRLLRNIYPMPAAAGKTSYAVIHISDSDELEVFEEENRDGGAPSSD